MKGRGEKKEKNEERKRIKREKIKVLGLEDVYMRGEGERRETGVGGRGR